MQSTLSAQLTARSTPRAERCSAVRPLTGTRTAVILATQGLRPYDASLRRPATRLGVDESPCLCWDRKIPQQACARVATRSVYDRREPPWLFLFSSSRFSSSSPPLLLSLAAVALLLLLRWLLLLLLGSSGWSDVEGVGLAGARRGLVTPRWRPRSSRLSSVGGSAPPSGAQLWSCGNLVGRSSW